MIIQLVAFDERCRWARRVEMTAALLNASNASLVVFSGHTLRDLGALETLCGKITNRRSQAIIEVKDYSPVRGGGFLKLRNALFHIVDGELRDMFSSQLFATSDEINGNIVLAKRLMRELAERRRIEVEGCRITILQCGGEF